MNQHQLNEQLFNAIEADDIEAVRKAIEEGADIYARTEYEDTVLHEAAAYGHTAIAELLIEEGANIDTQNKCGSTPLFLAVCFGNKETAKLLKQHGGTL